MVSPKDRAVKR